MKRALITGITGQDGSYLAELLLAKGYEVHGVVRRSSSFNTERLDGIYQDPHAANYRLRLVYGDLDDASSLNRDPAEHVKPDEIYNLGAQSHVRVSFDVPEYTASTVAMGTLRLLEAIRESGWSRAVRFYQASSSEMFGAAAPPQDENTPFLPRSPYACAKVFAHQLCQNYRDAYGMFICVRHPVQPRVAPPRDPVRHPQDHARGGPHPPRPRQEALPRQPRRASATGASPATTSRPCG